MDPDPIYHRYGRFHYEHRVNGELDHQYDGHIVYSNRRELHQSMQFLEQEIFDGNVTITIKKVKEDWDDIPSPTPEDLEAAIQIMDQIQLPDPEVPKCQETSEKSWDWTQLQLR